MDEAEEDVLAFMTFPKEHRAKICSTNPLERLDGEIERRTDVVGIFPTRARSPVSSAPSCSSRTTSGPSSAATCALRRWRPSATLPAPACQPSQPDRGSTPPGGPGRSYTITRDTTCLASLLPELEAVRVGGRHVESKPGVGFGGAPENDRRVPPRLHPWLHGPDRARKAPPAVLGLGIKGAWKIFPGRHLNVSHEDQRIVIWSRPSLSARSAKYDSVTTNRLRRKFVVSEIA